MSETSCASKTRFPVNISKSTHPNAQMSVLLSTALPRACSGLIYAAVPTMTPSLVPFVRVGELEESLGTPSSTANEESLGTPSSTANAFANPKSKIFGIPSNVTLMFAGFKSL